MKVIRSATVSLVIILILLFLGLPSCQDGKDKKLIDPDDIYLDYKIEAREEDDNLTILLQFRDTDDEGDPVSISPGTVKVDDETIPADSSKMKGHFYELHKPNPFFVGKHTIVYTDRNHKEYVEEFTFQPLILLTNPPDTIGREDSVVFEFSGVRPDERIEIIFTDTAFSNDDINRSAPRGSNRVVMMKSDFANLRNGPVQIEFIKETQRRVKNGTMRSGRFIMTYSLRRELFLKY